MTEARPIPPPSPRYKSLSHSLPRDLPSLFSFGPCCKFTHRASIHNQTIAFIAIIAEIGSRRRRAIPTALDSAATCAPRRQICRAIIVVDIISVVVGWEAMELHTVVVVVVVGQWLLSSSSRGRSSLEEALITRLARVRLFGFWAGWVTWSRDSRVALLWAWRFDERRGAGWISSGDFLVLVGDAAGTNFVWGCKCSVWEFRFFFGVKEGGIGLKEGGLVCCEAEWRRRERRGDVWSFFGVVEVGNSVCWTWGHASCFLIPLAGLRFGLWLLWLGL